jgi:hypothetical protein
MKRQILFALVAILTSTQVVAMRTYFDSVGAKTSDDYLEFEAGHILMTIGSISIPDTITVD